MHSMNTLAVACVERHKLLCELQLIFEIKAHCLIFLDSTHITYGHFINTTKSILAGFISNFTMWFSLSDDYTLS